MSTTQYVSKYNTRVPVPPVLSGIERVNFKSGAVIYPGTDGNLYGVTTSGTAVNLTSGFSADLSALEAAVADLQGRMTSLETLMTRAVALLASISGVNISTTPPV